MRPGLKPQIVSQIFAPVPAARSRCIAAFIAIARQRLPLTLRHEASHIIALFGIVLLVTGFVFDAVLSFAGTMIGIGWGCLGLAFLATMCQDRFSYGQTRWRLIRQLDEARRSTGLEEAILPESLEFLESSAQQWERIEHALESQIWRDQHRLKQRIEATAHRVMEEILVLECGNTAEAGTLDEHASDLLAAQAADLKALANQVDAFSAAITTYPREAFDSNGVEPQGVLSQMEDLETALEKLNPAP